MSPTTNQTTYLERRVQRLEEWARRASRLDEPAIIDGEPVIMGDLLPIELRIIAALAAAGILFVVGLVVLAAFGVKI